MNKRSSVLKLALISSLLGASASAYAAYDSGSTGADGAFSPTVSQSIQLPADGKFNYTSVTIPTGVTITYVKNAANTPVTILSQGNVTIDGIINVSATTVGVDFTTAGLGGPGGYNGGGAGTSGGAVATWVNGYTGLNAGRAGLGPGGGAPGAVHKAAVQSQQYYSYSYGYLPDVAAGGGGAYGSAPPPAGGGCPTTPGVTYGNAMLIPLIGGSGGGAGAGGAVSPGSAGGGGGGAILIASSGIIDVKGSILANGGSPLSPGAVTGTSLTRGAHGGGGSGGAIRLIATTISGNGVISAAGGTSPSEYFISTTYGYYVCANAANGSMNGGDGRIRFDTDTLLRTTGTAPGWSRGTPNPVFVPGTPTLSISSIGGVAVPAGDSSIALPSGFTNPVTVNFVTTGVMVGNLIKLTVTPPQGVATSVTSAATAGTIDNATASVSVTLPSGSNTLQASVTYTLVASAGDAMATYAMGERVETVTLASTLGSKESKVTLTTVSGKQFVVPASVLAAIPG